MTKTRIEIPRKRIGSTVKWFGDTLTVEEFVGYEMTEFDSNSETYGPRYRMSDGNTILFYS